MYTQTNKQTNKHTFIFNNTKTSANTFKTITNTINITTTAIIAATTTTTTITIATTGSTTTSMILIPVFDIGPYST